MVGADDAFKLCNMVALLTTVRRFVFGTFEADTLKLRDEDSVNSNFAAKSYGKVTL